MLEKNTLSKKITAVMKTKHTFFDAAGVMSHLDTRGEYKKKEKKKLFFNKTHSCYLATLTSNPDKKTPKLGRVCIHELY